MGSNHMTWYGGKKERCIVCDTESEYTTIGSTNRDGYPDLDGRPPEMERSTIDAWVQRCPACGYCALDVSVRNDKAAVVVRSQKYQDQLTSTEYSKLANAYLCSAIVSEECLDFAAAMRSLVYAAWVCDDEHRQPHAIICRTKAVEMLLLFEQHGQCVSNPDGDITALLVDLLRRSGRLESALNIIATRYPGIADASIKRTLDFQKALIARNDVSCHTFAEVSETQNNPTNSIATEQPPNQIDVSKERNKHHKYLRAKLPASIDYYNDSFISPLGAITADEAEILHRYGIWMRGLSSGNLCPLTEAQARFVEVCHFKRDPETIYEKVWRKFQLMKPKPMLSRYEEEYDSYCVARPTYEDLLSLPSALDEINLTPDDTDEPYPPYEYWL